MNVRKKLTASFVLLAVVVLSMLAPGKAFVQSRPDPDSYPKAPWMFDRQADPHARYEPQANIKTGKAADGLQITGHEVKAIGDGTRASRRGAGPGDLLWEDRFDASGFEQAFAVAALKHNVFVGGFTSTLRNGFYDRDFLVRAYDERTGELVWQDRADKGPDAFASGVATDNQRVFVSGTAFIAGRGYDWLLRAYDARSGELIWEDVFDLSGRFDFSRGTALAVGKGLVFLGGYATDAQGNADWHLRAYDATSGALVWQDHLVSGQLLDTAYTLAVDGETLLAGGGGSSAAGGVAVVRAYNVRTGTLLWQQDTPGPFAATFVRSITAQDGRVYACTLMATPSGKIYTLIVAYDTTTGAPLWQDQVAYGGDLDFIQQITAREGRVYTVGLGGPGCIADASPPSNCDTLVRSYDGATGTVLWERQIDLSGLDDYGRLVAASNGTVFVSSVKGPIEYIGQIEMGGWTVQALDSETGELRWENTGGELEVTLYNMIVHRGNLFIPGRSVDPATNNWDFIVRAYDARGPNSDNNHEVRKKTELGEAAVNNRFEDNKLKALIAAPGFGFVPATFSGINIRKSQSLGFESCGIIRAALARQAIPDTRQQGTYIRTALFSGAVRFLPNGLHHEGS